MLIPLEVKNIVADYGSKALIRNLSFIVRQPAFIAVIGHNGSGKTTFFKALSGQLPFGGEVLIDNQRLHTHKNPIATGLIALLAQKNTVGFSISVQELVVMGRFRLKKFFQPYDDTDYKLARQALELLELAHLADQNFIELSGGEQQLVWLAQLMVQDAKIYLLDEPTQQLDVYNKKQVFSLLMNWVNLQHKTVLCITHDLHNLAGMEGYILNLSQTQPFLEPISRLSIEKHIALLESKNIN